MKTLVDNKKKCRNYTLDLLKFISAFMIVCIHFKFPGEVGKVVTVLARFAVPIFFMISGYYSYDDDLKKIKGKIINILKIYFGAFVLYFVFQFLAKTLGGKYDEALWFASTYFRIQYIYKVILFNESLAAIHLWFLGALAYTYSMHYLIVKVKVKENVVYVLSCVLLLAHLALGIGSSVLGIQMPAFLQQNYVLRNFLFMGFPLFSIGQFIKRNEDTILKKVTGKHLALLILLCIADAVVVYKTDWTKDLYLGAVLLSCALFVFALKMQDRQYPDKLIAVFNTSTNVYLLHVLIGELFAMTLIESFGFYQGAKPILIFAVSVLVAMFAHACKQRLLHRKDKKDI